MSQHQGDFGNDGYEYEYEPDEATPQELFFDALGDEAEWSVDDQQLAGLMKFAQIRRYDADSPTQDDFCQMVRIVLPDWLRQSLSAKGWETMTERLAATLYENPDWNQRLVAFWRRMLEETA